MPDLLPRLEFRRREPEPRDVALVQAHDLRLDDIDQARSIGWRQRLRGTPPEIGRGDLFVHRLRDDVSHTVGDELAVPQPERIGLAEGLTDRGVAGAGPLIGLAEHVAQQLDPIELVDTQDTADVVVVRNVDERQRAQIVANERQIRGEARHPLVDVLERL